MNHRFTLAGVAAVLGALTLTACGPMIAGTAVIAPVSEAAAVSEYNTAFCQKVFTLSDKAFEMGEDIYTRSDSIMTLFSIRELPSLAALNSLKADTDDFTDALTAANDAMDGTVCDDPNFADDLDASLSLTTQGSKTSQALADVYTAVGNGNFNQSQIATAKQEITYYQSEYAAYVAARATTN